MDDFELWFQQFLDNLLQKHTVLKFLKWKYSSLSDEQREDIEQDCLIGLWKGRKNLQKYQHLFDNEKFFRIYVNRCADRQAIKQWKHDHGKLYLGRIGNPIRWPTTTNDDGKEIEIEVDSLLRSDDDVKEKEEYELLERCATICKKKFKFLPDTYKMLDYRLLGYTYPEIAKVFGTSMQSVEQHTKGLARKLQKIAEEIQKKI